MEGIVFGNWGEVSEATHSLVDVLATSRVRVAEPQTDKKGRQISETQAKAMAEGFIRRKLSIAGVKAQCHSLLGRLEGLGPGLIAATKRRKQAIDQEQRWRKETLAHIQSTKQGFNIIRRGFSRFD